MTAAGARKLAALMWIAGAGAIAYAGWVFASRYARDRKIEQAQQARADDRYRAYAGPASGDVRIVAFYGSPGLLIRGEQALICYGVENARAVRIEPPIDSLSPASNRCIADTPKKNTTYKLVVEGKDGKTVSESFSVVVEPPAPEFTLLATGPKEIDRGDRYGLCYGVKNATRVRLDPMGMSLPSSPKHCVMFGVGRSMDFTLTAWGEDGRTVSEKFAVAVKGR